LFDELIARGMVEHDIFIHYPFNEIIK